MPFSVLSAQMGVDARPQLCNAERFGQIVVRAKSKPEGNVMLHCLCSQKENGTVHQRTDLLTIGKAVDVRHHNVKQDQIIAAQLVGGTCCGRRADSNQVSSLFVIHF